MLFVNPICFVYIPPLPLPCFYPSPWVLCNRMTTSYWYILNSVAAVNHTLRFKWKFCDTASTLSSTAGEHVTLCVLKTLISQRSSFPTCWILYSVTKKKKKSSNLNHNSVSLRSPLMYSKQQEKEVIVIILGNFVTAAKDDASSCKDVKKQIISDIYWCGYTTKSYVKSSTKRTG